MKKNSLWLLPFYMAVATYFYYEKVRRAMRTAVIMKRRADRCALQLYHTSLKPITNIEKLNLTYPQIQPIVS